MSMIPNKNLKISKRTTNGSRKVVLQNYGKTRTQQHTKDQCDINHIMKKFQKTRTLPLMDRVPIYDDFTNAVDYKESLERIMHAESQFNNLPSAVRNKFKNDPSKFLEFVNDEKNHSELVDMGLAKHIAGDHNMDGVVDEKDEPQTLQKGQAQVNNNAAEGGE
jgi:phage internal scaffolding protein